MTPSCCQHVAEQECGFGCCLKTSKRRPAHAVSSRLNVPRNGRRVRRNYDPRRGWQARATRGESRSHRPAAIVNVPAAPLNVCFSNRPVRVKHFQTFPPLQCRCRSRARVSLRTRRQCRKYWSGASPATYATSRWVIIHLRHRSGRLAGGGYAGMDLCISGSFNFLTIRE